METEDTGQMPEQNQGGTGQQEPSSPSIDIDGLAEKVASLVKGPLEPEPEPEFQELDYDGQINTLKDENKKLAEAVGMLISRSEASDAIPQAMDKVLAQIPNKDGMDSSVRDVLSDIAKKSPGLLKSLSEDDAKTIADMAIGKHFRTQAAGGAKKPEGEPVVTEDTKQTADAKAAFVAVRRREPTPEEFKTWLENYKKVVV